MMENVAAQIDLNQATAEELSTLPGIGLTLAQRIVSFREAVRPFEEVIELTAVPGISERMVQSFRDRVFVALDVKDSVETEDAGKAVEPDADIEMPGEATEEPQPDLEPEPETIASVERVEEIESEAEQRVGSDEPEEDAAADESDEQEATMIPGGEGILGRDRLADALPPPWTDSEPETVGRSGSLETPEQTRATPAPEPVSGRDRHAQRRGCMVLLLGGILGAFTGTILSLAIIAALNNGTLSFSQADDRLGRELDDARRQQAELMDRLSSIESQLGEVEARAQETAAQQADAEQTLSAVRQDLSVVEGDISRLENADNEFEERLAGVAAAAETFEAFLDRLRDLLFDFQGPPPTPLPSPTATMTPSPVPTDTPELEATASPETSPASTGLPTRTPRPTSTRFPIATGTPEPQP